MPPTKGRTGSAFGRLAEAQAATVAGQEQSPGQAADGDPEEPAVRLVPVHPEGGTGPEPASNDALPAAGAGAVPPVPVPAMVRPLAGEAVFEDLRERTNDAVPPAVATRARARANSLRVDMGTVIALAVSQAHTDQVLPGLVQAYRDRGAVATMFGRHAPKRQPRKSPPVRLNYNPTREEARGYQDLATQLGVSRTVMVSLALAHYLGMKDPAAMV